VKNENFYREMVYIQGRMGNNKKGLKLLIDHIGDVKQAIDFIETQNDQDLWEDLIDYSMQRPKFVSDLLEHIGAYVDPLRLVKRIPEGMNIEKLRDRLVKIISDYNLQMSLREGCMNVLKADCVDLAMRLSKSQKRGVKIEDAYKCAICGSTIVENKPNSVIIIFYCNHVYHHKCLKNSQGEAAGEQPQQAVNKPQTPTKGADTTKIDETEKLWCTICQNQKQSRIKSSATRKLGKP